MHWTFKNRGYPVRLKYADFAKTYRFSAFGSTTVSNIYSNAKAESQAIIDKLSEANDTLGMQVWANDDILQAIPKYVSKTASNASRIFCCSKNSKLQKRSFCQIYIYPKLKELRKELRTAMHCFENQGFHILEDALARAEKAGANGWPDVKQARQELQRARERESIAIRLTDITQSWGNKVYGIQSSGDEKLPQLEKTLDTAHKIGLGSKMIPQYSWLSNDNPICGKRARQDT